MDTLGYLDNRNRLKEYLEERNYESNPGLERALAALTGLLQSSGGCKWLAGGSAGLWLQGAELAAPPRDIDIYAEKEAAVHLHECLKPFAVDTPKWDRSGIYVSLLSHYKIEDYTVELVGGFEVRASLGHYKVEIENLLDLYAAEIMPGLKVMPLAHEYIFNLLRSRPDRYKAVAEQMNRRPELHLPLLEEMAERNGWTKHQQTEMDKLSPIWGWQNNMR
ncbi:hypothetical protein [Paenibacillus pinistramenti]|uniref:hypothetical protein n=1 Tax=Paenibacillus pinistramenti TaxID=1768003 RepID=UPI0011080124|nr:hypothetical protein [Paenibacillus pinistramenti]